MSERFRSTTDDSGPQAADRQEATERLLSQAQKNTQSMLAGMLRSLGFTQVTVGFS
jgi:hypothetical protein